MRYGGLADDGWVPDIVELLRKTQGSATYAQLRGLTPARSIRAALAAGSVHRVARGHYALVEQASPMTVARAHGGVLSHESAALHWGFEVITRPAVPHVMRKRNQRARVTDLACISHRSDAPALDGATTPLRTILDCARTLPFGEALAIADSALRCGAIEPEELRMAAVGLAGRGRGRAIRVAELADPRAESALESMLRARVIEAGFNDFVPQWVISDDAFYARVDLASPARRIVLEADSFAFHGHRVALRRDCRRHVNLTTRGWSLLRYSWEDVILDDSWVGESLNGMVCGHQRSQNLVRRAA